MDISMQIDMIACVKIYLVFLPTNSERKPEKRLPHLRKAAGAEITQSRLGEVVTIGMSTI